MTTFADLSPEAREFVKRAVVEAVRIAREQETEACADAIRALPTRDHNAGQWGGYGLGVQPCVKVEDAVAAIVGRGPGGASAEPGGAAPECLCHNWRITPDAHCPAHGMKIREAMALSGGGGTPAAGEREALRAALESLLHVSPESAWESAFNDGVKSCLGKVAALRAPAPPTPHES